MRWTLVALIFLIVVIPLLSSFSTAEDYVVINSYDGQDVLSGIFYANVRNLSVHFMVPFQSNLNFISKLERHKDIFLIQSATFPISGFLESDLKANNNSVSLFSLSNATRTNFALAELSKADSIILIDSAYSDSALSVLAYAKYTHSYVIFADKHNAKQIRELVISKKINLTLYGYLDSEVEAAVSSLNPFRIGHGLDKYADNVEIVGRVLEKYNRSSVILSDGSFIENAISSGVSPVILTGNLVPPVTYNFIKDSVRSNRLKSALMIKNTLSATGYDLRERIKRELIAEGTPKNFTVVVKFGQALLGSIQTGVLGLDLFPLPAYHAILNITSLFFNPDEQKVFIGIENIGEIPLFYISELKLFRDGQIFHNLVNSEKQKLERNETGFVIFPFSLDASSYGNFTGTMLIRYGSSVDSLDTYALFNGPIAKLDYNDTSNLTISSAKFDSSKQQLLLQIKNNGLNQAYFFAKVQFLSSGKLVTLASSAIRTIDSGSFHIEEFPFDYKLLNFSIGQNVTFFVTYGDRFNFLLKNLTQPFTVEILKNDLRIGNETKLPSKPFELPSLDFQFSDIFLGCFASLILLLLIFGGLLMLMAREKKKDTGKKRK